MQSPPPLSFLMSPLPLWIPIKTQRTEPRYLLHIRSHDLYIHTSLLLKKVVVPSQLKIKAGSGFRAWLSPSLNTSMLLKEKFTVSVRIVT